MKPHPRIRKTVKWGGAIVAMLLVFMWLGSTRHGLLWRDAAGRTVAVRGGRFIATQCAADQGGLIPIDWRDSPAPYELDFSFSWTLDRTRGRTFLAMPLWAPMLIAVAFSAAAWRFDILARRRERLNLCPKCNYDRVGLSPGAVCPECGTRSASRA